MCIHVCVRACGRSRAFALYVCVCLSVCLSVSVSVCVHVHVCVPVRRYYHAKWPSMDLPEKEVLWAKDMCLSLEVLCWELGGGWGKVQGVNVL